MSSAVHEQPMEVKRCRLITQIIVDVDEDVIANIRIYAGNRPLSIDANSCAVESSIRIGSHPTDLEVVRHRSSLYHRQKRADERNTKSLLETGHCYKFRAPRKRVRLVKKQS